MLKGPVFFLFWQFFELGHCHRNSPSQLGFLNTKFWGWSGLFPVLGPKNFLFGHPIFIGEFQWQCASIKIAKKGKRPDFQALDDVLPPSFMKTAVIVHIPRIWKISFLWAVWVKWRSVIGKRSKRSMTY